MSRADLGKDPQEVASMFDAVARRYDLVNDLLSLGRTKAWRKRVVKIIKPGAGMRILDIAAGPGSSSEPLHKAGGRSNLSRFFRGNVGTRKESPSLSNFC